MKRFALTVVALGAFASIQSCDPYKCFDQVRPPLYIQVYETRRPWVGDAFFINASVGVDCEKSLYSGTNPSSFTWESSDTTVATVSRFGEVTAVAPGNATIKVSARGETATSRVLVTDPVSAVVITFTPAAPKVGDLVTVRMEPRRADGTMIDSVLVTRTLTIRTPGVTQTGTLLGSMDPYLSRFQASSAGEFEITATAQRATGVPKQASAKVVIVPP
jgi:hypothetical protein